MTRMIENMELLSFKEQNEFLEAMKALVEKTGSFGEESAAVAEKEVQVQTDREMKLKMFDELRNIDEGLYVNDMVRPQENMAFDRENIAAQLRMAFSQEEHGEGDSFEEEDRNQKEEGEDEGAIGRLEAKRLRMKQK